MKGWSWWVIKSTSLPYLTISLSLYQWTSSLSILPWQIGQGIWNETPGGTIVVLKSQLGCVSYTGGSSQGSPWKGFVSRLSQGKGLLGLSEGSWGNRTIVGSKGVGHGVGGGLTDGDGAILWVARLIISSWKWEVDLAWKTMTTLSAPHQKATNPPSKVKRRTPHTSPAIITCCMPLCICTSSMKIKSISSNHHWLSCITAGGISDIRWQTPWLSRAHNLFEIE